MWLEIVGMQSGEVYFDVVFAEHVTHRFMTRGGAESFMNAMEAGDY